MATTTKTPSSTSSTSTTPTVTPTIVSSFAHNPLTTAFSRPESCTGLYRSSFLSIIDDKTSCMPSGFDPDPTFYFSPGLECPVGYVSACHDNTGVPSITTVTCCPTYQDDITLSCVKTNTLRNIFATLFCTWIAPQETRLPLTVSEGGVTSTIQGGFTSPGGLNAFGVRMVYQQSDLDAHTATSVPNSQITDNPNPNPSPDPDSQNNGLSTGAKIAIGVVVPLVVLTLAALLFLLFRKRRQKRGAESMLANNILAHDQRQQKKSLMGSSELPGNVPQELHGQSRVPPVELPGDYR